MLVLGIVLLAIGLLIGLKILFWLGVIALICGAVLFLAGGVAGRSIGGRRYWY
jgi:hypothetical protein